MSKTREQVIKELDSKIPRSEVSSRESGNGQRLSYLTSYYVINRLNETLGQGNWSYRIQELTCVREGTVKRYSGEVFSANYISRVVLQALIGDRLVEFQDVGYGDGTDKADPGKPHELAAKEAVTDALKRCAKNLGQSLGLALYEKEQTNVEEDEAPKPVAVQSSGPSKNSNNKNSDSSSQASHKFNTNISPKREAIKAGVKVLIAKQKVTAVSFKEKYSLKVKVDELPDSEVESLYVKVKTDFPELNLN